MFQFRIFPFDKEIDRCWNCSQNGARACGDERDGLTVFECLLHSRKPERLDLLCVDLMDVLLDTYIMFTEFLLGTGIGAHEPSDERVIVKAGLVYSVGRWMKLMSVRIANLLISCCSEEGDNFLVHGALQMKDSARNLCEENNEEQR